MSTNNTVQLNIATANTSKAAKDVKSLKEQIKDLRNEMAGLTKGTAEYDQAAAQLGDLMHQQAEITESAKLATADYGQTLSNITSISAGVVGSISAINGVMNVMGASSDEAAEAMRKIQSLMAIVQGLNQLDQAEKAFKGLWTRIKLTTTARQKDTQETIKNSGAATANAAATNIDAAAKRKDAVASGVATAANTTLATSFRNLGLAMKSFMMSNPFTLIIMGLTTAISLITNLVNKTKEAAEEARKVRYDNAIKDIDDMAARLNDMNTEYSQEVKRDIAELALRERMADYYKQNNRPRTNAEIKNNLKELEEEIKTTQILRDAMEITQGTDSEEYRKAAKSLLEAQAEYNLLQMEYYKNEMDRLANDILTRTRKIRTASRKEKEEIAKEVEDLNNLREKERENYNTAAEKYTDNFRNSKKAEADEYRRQQQAAAEAQRKRLEKEAKNNADYLKKIKDEYELNVIGIERAYKDNEITTQEYYDALIKAHQDYLEKYKAAKGSEKLTVAREEDAITELERKAVQDRIDTQKKLADSENYRGPRAVVDESRYQNAQNTLTDQEGGRYAEQQEELFQAWWLKKFMLIEQYDKQEVEKEREHNDELNRLAMERYSEEENVLKENFDADKGYEDTRFQNEMAALEARHEAKLISEQDYYLELESLEREHQEKMDELQADYDGGRNEIEANRIQTLRDIAQQRYDIEKDYYERRLELDEAYISAYQTLSSSIGGILSKVQEQYAEGSRQYEKIQEASIIMDTVSGALSAFMSGVKSGIPAPGNFIYAGVLSALALAEGQLALNNLHSKKLSAGAANAPSVSAYQTVAYETGSDLQDSIRDQRVYVTETDITDTVNRVSVIESEASF